MAKIPDTFSKEKKAYQTAFDKVDSISSSWLLSETEWNIYDNAHDFILNIASSFHPDSRTPILEVRVGKLISGLKVLNKKLLDLTNSKGFKKMANFRFKHAISVHKVWEKKQEWEASQWAKFLKKVKLYFIAKWAFTAFRFFDISFWAIKTFTGLTHHFAIKTLLVHLYLELGEFAHSIYREEKKSDLDFDANLDDNWEDLSPDTNWTQTKVPTEIKIDLGPVRKDILFSKTFMDWNFVKNIYWESIKTIACHYHPNSENPLYEVKLYNGLIFASRLLDMASSLEKRPEIRKVLNIRIAQAVNLKNKVDTVLDFPIVEWLRKYKLGRVAQIASLAYKTIKNRHPGFLLKDLLTTLLTEGVKRWFYVSLFDKVVGETCILFDETEESLEKNLLEKPDSSISS